jgi:hypothetical protein
VKSCPWSVLRPSHLVARMPAFHAGQAGSKPVWGTNFGVRVRMPLTKEERELVHAVIENEGFDYAFMHKTTFEREVKDPEFHRLREVYLSAHKALADYVGEPDEEDSGS